MTYMTRRRILLCLGTWNYVVLTDPAYDTRNGRGQTSFAHNVLCKEQIEDAVRFVSNVMGHGARCLIIFPT